MSANRRSTSPRPSDELVVLIPPPDADLDIATLAGALDVAICEPVDEWPWLLAVGDTTGAVALVFASDGTLEPAAMTTLVEVASGVICDPCFVEVIRTATDDPAVTLAEARLERWRAARAVVAAAGGRLLDSIVAGPQRLRSLAVTAGDAPEWWDAAAPVGPA